MFDTVVGKISELQASKPHIVVAISGFGGSGKTTLANSLRDRFGIRDEQIVRIDHLYSDNPDGPGILDQVDWPLLLEILESVRKRERLRYQAKGFTGEKWLVDEAVAPIVIVEGIRLLQSNLMPYFDLSVWIDFPYDRAVARAKARDRAQGEPEATVSRWDTDWGPKDRAYFDRYRPDRLASLLYKFQS